MTSTARILSVGAAAPTLRLAASEVNAAWGREGGRGTAAVCGPDEDVLTLAAAAALRALDAAGLDPGLVDGLWWGTSRPPFAEGPSHAVLAAALGLSPHAGGSLSSGSAHAGIEALLGAADAVAAGTARLALVVAADSVLPGPGTGFEARSGAGAVAFVIGTDGGNAFLGARTTRSRPFLDRYRGDREETLRDLYDPRLFREEVFLPITREVGGQLAALEPTAWSLPDPDGRLGAVLAKNLADGGAAASAPVYAAIGDAGAAAALLGAASALDAQGVVAALAYGGGRATGVIFTVDGPVPGAAGVLDALAGGKPTTYTAVLRSRGLLVKTGETVDMGVPPESAMFVRGADEMLQLLGARCGDCGTINTPPSIHPHCIACGGSKFELIPLARHGIVHTFVINYTMPEPFEAPLPIAVLDLDDGARVMLQVAGDGVGLEIGSEMELVLRRYAHERGVPVYGYKALLVATETEES